MTAVTAVLADQMVALNQLGRRRLWKTLTGLQVDDLMVALQATRFLEPL